MEALPPLTLILPTVNVHYHKMVFLIVFVIQEIARRGTAECGYVTSFISILSAKLCAYTTRNTARRRPAVSSLYNFLCKKTAT